VGKTHTGWSGRTARWDVRDGVAPERRCRARHLWNASRPTGVQCRGPRGRADTDDAGTNEIEIAAAREDGTSPFGPTLAGGTAAGLHSIANPGELLLLTCRLLPLLPLDLTADPPGKPSALEHVVQVE
jgi:hypothetical protein